MINTVSLLHRLYFFYETVFKECIQYCPKNINLSNSNYSFEFCKCKKYSREYTYKYQEHNVGLSTGTSISTKLVPTPN